MPPSAYQAGIRIDPISTHHDLCASRGNCHSPRAAKDYVDGVQVRVEGPVTRRLMDTFARDWSFTTDEELGGDAWWPAIDFAGSVFARGIHSGPDADMYKLETILGAALTQAQTRVRIVTPYFRPASPVRHRTGRAARGCSRDSDSGAMRLLFHGLGDAGASTLFRRCPRHCLFHAIAL